MTIEEISSSLLAWSFLDFHNERGDNEILEWLNSLPKGAKAKINARISALQGFPIFPEQYFSAYKSAPGLFELRISFAGVQYRPFGFYGPSRKQFCLLVGGIEKGKIPKSLLRIADDRRKVVERDHSRAKPHDFS